jgi:outer membrane protein assembly factor BamB
VRSLWILLFALALAADWPSATFAATGWTQFGYNPGHTGYNPKETVIDSQNVSSLTNIATLTTPAQIVDPVVISDGVAYVNSNYDNTLYAFDITTGQTIWTFPGTNLDAPTGIAVKGGTVFVTCAVDSQHGGLCALKAKTGKLLWDWAYLGNVSLPQSAPVVSGNTVYFEEFQTYGDWLTALDIKTGTVLWQFGYCDDEGICASLGENVPAVDNGMVYVGCSLVGGLQGICGVNASTGAEVWAAQLGGAINGNGYSWGDGNGNLIAERGTVYANYMTAICYQCTYTVDVVALNGANGSTLWDTAITPVLNDQYGPLGPPAIHGKSVYSVLYCCDASNDSGLVELNAKAGQVGWHTETSAWLNSSPSLVNDVIFTECTNSSGTICAFDAKGGAFLWSSPDSGEGCTQAPTITGGIAFEICHYNDVCLYSPN